MASAWLEVNLEDGNSKPMVLPLEWALYPGGWRAKLESLNLGRLPAWEDDEQEDAVPDGPVLNLQPVVRPKVRSARNNYGEVEPPPVLAGLIRPEQPLPLDWDIFTRHRAAELTQDPDELSALLSEFDVEDEVVDNDDLDRAQRAESKNDQGPNPHQVRANRLIGNRAVVNRGELADEAVYIIGWPGVEDDHVRVQWVSGGPIYSVPMDDLNVVDARSAELVESLRSAARREPVSWAPPRPEFSSVLPPEEVPEMQPKEPVTVEPDLPIEEPDPLPDQEPEVRVLHDLQIHSIAFTDQPSPFPGAGVTIAEHHPLTAGQAAMREEADRTLVAPTSTEVAEQAAKGTEKLKAEAAALKRWRRTELPGLLQLVKQGYNPETSVHFRALTAEQREELHRAVR